MPRSSRRPAGSPPEAGRLSNRGIEAGATAAGGRLADRSGPNQRERPPEPTGCRRV